MLYVLNHDFYFLAYRNIIKFCRRIHFVLVTLKYEVSSQQLFILSVFRNKYKTLTVFVKKTQQGHQAFPKYVGLKFPKFQQRKGKFSFLSVLNSKVIGLAKFDLRILNKQS